MAIDGCIFGCRRCGKGYCRYIVGRSDDKDNRHVTGILRAAAACIALIVDIGGERNARAGIRWRCVDYGSSCKLCQGTIHDYSSCPIGCDGKTSTRNCQSSQRHLESKLNIRTRCIYIPNHDTGANVDGSVLRHRRRK